MNIFTFLKNLIFGKKEAIIPGNPGLIESPTDHRDILSGMLKKRFTKRPEKYTNPYILNVKNQGNTPHCVGYTCATLKEFLERREGHNIQFDGDWIYRECKKIDGIPNFPGTYFRTGLKVLQKIGAMPVGGGDPSKYRIGGYARVDTDVESIKQALYEFDALLFGFRGSNQGWRTAFIRKPHASEKQWGHAVYGNGYDATYIDGQNSFGKNWGDKGLFHFAKNYRPTEAWGVLVDLPNNWKELLGKDKVKPKHKFNRNLWRGLRHDDVKRLQECLKSIGCFPNMDCTTFFGDITLKAVKTFQKRYSIEPPYGFVGPLTLAKLNKLFS